MRERKRKVRICFVAVLTCIIVIGSIAFRGWRGGRDTPQQEQGDIPEENGLPREGLGRAEEEGREAGEQWKKGYDLPVRESEKTEAEEGCIKVMELIAETYKSADKGEATNVILSDETLFEMRDKIKETGDPVYAKVSYSNMKNYKQVDRFLKDCKNGKKASVVIYAIRSDGGIGRSKYIFDGMDMYQLEAGAAWNENDEPEVGFISHSRIKQWKYTEKGWFCYELCVPEYPEVSEMVDGSCLIRVKPMSQENRSFTVKIVSGLGYQGNNLLCSNWDENHMKELDYNGLYEYLYEMKYKKKFDEKKYADGIPKDQFEKLIMEYLPIKAEQIQEYASFDQKKKTYDWVRLGYYNYTLSFLGTSVPEVIKAKKNKDGTYTLTVAAVCEMVLCDDELITHKLTVQMEEDGSFKYLSNKIREDVLRDLPAYQYRVDQKRG